MIQQRSTAARFGLFRPPLQCRLYAILPNCRLNCSCSGVGLKSPPNRPADDPYHLQAQSPGSPLLGQAENFSPNRPVPRTEERLRKENESLRAQLRELELQRLRFEQLHLAPGAPQPQQQPAARQAELGLSPGRLRLPLPPPALVARLQPQLMLQELGAGAAARAAARQAPVVVAQERQGMMTRSQRRQQQPLPEQPPPARTEEVQRPAGRTTRQRGAAGPAALPAAEAAAAEDEAWHMTADDGIDIASSPRPLLVRAYGVAELVLGQCAFGQLHAAACVVCRCTAHCSCKTSHRLSLHALPCCCFAGSGPAHGNPRPDRACTFRHLPRYLCARHDLLPVHPDWHLLPVRLGRQTP